VSVNGLPAKFAPDGEDLVITPKLSLLKGLPFLVQVSHFTAHPVIPDPNNLLGAPFFITPDGSATAGQPDGTHNFLPSNDHPRDKATFTIRFDVPAGEPAFANGVLLSKSTSRGRTHYRYLMRQPMATELIQLAVGNYAAIDRGRHRGLPIRDVVAPALQTLMADKLPLETDHIDWMENWVRGESASTADFVDLASQVAHQDLHAFLNAWLYGTKTPPMPGHPDWTVDPVDQAARVQSFGAPRELRVLPKR
jgi:aminopeptidase N